MDTVYFTVKGVPVDPWGNPIELPKVKDQKPVEEKDKK